MIHPAAWRVKHRAKVTALDAARAVCPPDKDVVIMGGGNVIAQAIDQGLVDDVVLHVSPMVMGAGTPLWAGVARRQLRHTDVRVLRYATHITYALTENEQDAD